MYHDDSNDDWNAKCITALPNPSHPRVLYDRRVPQLAATVLIGLLIAFPSGVTGEDTPTVGLLRVAKTQELQSFLPKGARLLHDPVAIEKFLEALDGSPPNWAELHGEHGARHDEMLFALNRERDRVRAGRPALAERITFLWDGVLSSYDPDKAGFLVAVGPEVISTKWGLVRFKPESLYAELVAVPPTDLRGSLQARVARGESVQVIVAMTGRLVQDEALIYDFAHEVPGQGMVMPMVRVERMDYYLVPP
jgi:hypothetical protein